MSERDSPVGAHGQQSCFDGGAQDREEGFATGVEDGQEQFPVEPFAEDRARVDASAIQSVQCGQACADDRRDGGWDGGRGGIVVADGDQFLDQERHPGATEADPVDPFGV